MNKSIIITIITITVSLLLFFQFDSIASRVIPSPIQTALQSPIINLRDGDTFNLTAKIIKKKISGTEIRMLGYNGSIPGPLIRAPKSAEVTINFYEA